jgi:hypothetical protein
MNALSEHLSYHRPPPVVLGSGRTALIDKFCATMHALWLDAGTAADLSKMCSSIVTITTDLGVEFGLADVRPLKVSDVLPFADVAPAVPDPAAELDVFMIPESCDLDDLPAWLGDPPDAPIEHLVGFESPLSIPG